MASVNTKKSSDQLSGEILNNTNTKKMSFKNSSDLSGQLPDNLLSADQTVTLAISKKGNDQTIDLDGETVTIELEVTVSEDADEENEEVEEIDYSKNRMTNEDIEKIRSMLEEARHYGQLAKNTVRTIPNDKVKRHISASINQRCSQNDGIVNQINSTLNSLINAYAELDRLQATKERTFFKKQKSLLIVQIDSKLRTINMLSAKMRNFYLTIPTVEKIANDYRVVTRKSCPNPEWFPSVIKPRGKKSEKKKAMVVSGEYDTVTAMKTECDEPTTYYQHLVETFDIHYTRRGRCALQKDCLFYAVSNALENDSIVSSTHHPQVKDESNIDNNNRIRKAHSRQKSRFNFQEGQIVQCYKIGTNEQILKKDDCVMIRCPCYPNPNTAELIQNAANGKAVVSLLKEHRCNKYFMADDPNLLSAFTPDQLTQWNATVERMRINLLREKYGREYVNFCPNKNCKHCSEPFMDKIVMDALTGKLTSAVHFNKRSCPECETSWCLECGQQPYHDRKICQGPVEKLNEIFKDLEGEEREQAMAEVRICPNKNCQVVVYRDGGCDHLHCKQCSTHFCYRCRGTLDPDINRTYKHTCPAEVDYSSRIHATYSGGNDGYDVKVSLKEMTEKAKKKVDEHNAKLKRGGK
jgi:hypothetical protein